MISDEQRAYSKGYYAGRHKAFLDKTFLALLPTAMTQNNWQFGDKIISTVEDRVKLASYWAKEALHKRPLV